LQVLLVVKEEVRGEQKAKMIALELNTRSSIEVAKLPTFNEDATKILGFIAYRLYIRMRMRNMSVEEQI